MLADFKLSVGARGVDSLGVKDKGEKILGKESLPFLGRDEKNRCIGSFFFFFFSASASARRDEQAKREKRKRNRRGGSGGRVILTMRER